MKYTWEPEDIKGGCRLRRIKDEPCVLGYIIGATGDEKYVVIDLRDGGVMKPQTKAQMAEGLNAQGYKPESVEGADEPVAWLQTGCVTASVHAGQFMPLVVIFRLLLFFLANNLLRDRLDFIKRA